MLNKIVDHLKDLRDRQRIAICLSKGTAGMLSRSVDVARPATWEFSGFSQNGEDGILDVLVSHLRSSNRFALEIGCADGVENNTTWLMAVRKFGGLMVDGDRRLVDRARRLIMPLSVGLDVRQLFVSVDAMGELVRRVPADLDVFSLDIDGIDYYIARAALDAGLRPKIFVVEFNSVYGPERACTVPYRADFDFGAAHDTKLYYGVAIRAWRRFFEKRGYRFVTVDQNGVNAFFIDPAAFETGFVEGVRGLEFADNRYQMRKFGFASEEQWRLIANCEFVTVEE